MAKDYYKILGIDKNSSQEEIKKAFRQLARKYHPDVNPGNKEAEDKFKEINEAFQVLGNPEKKSQYDQYGEASFKPDDFQNFRNAGFDFEDLFSDFGFGDIFNIFSGRNGGREYAQEGSDLRYDLEITLEEAFTGIKTQIEIPIFETCDECEGTGAEKGHLKECDECEGSGEVRKVRRQSFMQFVSVSPCPKCKGSGKIIDKICHKCKGAGRLKKNEKIKVDIPAGVDDGQFLRIPGKGEPGHNAPSGDLYVVIHIKEHKYFKRKGSDLFIRIHIDLHTAILGDKFKIRSIDRDIKLKIPPGTQSHTKFRLKGLGMPSLRYSSRGDLFVKVIVDIPKDKLLGEALKKYLR